MTGGTWAGVRSTCAGGGKGATGIGILAGGRNTSEGPGAARLAAGGAAPGPIDIGAPGLVVLVKGCAETGAAKSNAMANATRAAARPAVAPGNLMSAFSAEIAANSSLPWLPPHL